MKTASPVTIDMPTVEPLTLADVGEQYHAHAVRVRGVMVGSAQGERPNLKRFFEWFGPLDSPAALSSPSRARPAGGLRAIGLARRSAVSYSNASRWAN